MSNLLALRQFLNNFKFQKRLKSFNDIYPRFLRRISAVLNSIPH